MDGIDRRRLLGLGLGFGMLGTLGTLWGLQPRQRQHPPFRRGKRARVQGSKRVVIVGGGLAGISAASELASRGYRVVLCEQANALGGKLSGWPIQLDGGTMPMEHGFHAFFRQYYNLRDLFARAGADRYLEPQTGYSVLFADRTQESFGRALLPFPLDLVEIVGRSPGLDLSDVSGDRPGMRELMSYDPVTTFARLDGLDMESFIQESGLGGRFAELILRPFGNASMNALSELSAAEAIRFFHFYMLGNPEGLGFDALTKSVHLSVIEPLRNHLEQLGVEIRTSARVKTVTFAAGRANGVVIEGQPAISPVQVVPTPGTAWEQHGELFVRSTPDGVQALSNRCSHMGCPVALAAKGGFVCPCHAGRYDVQGRPIAGPPPRPLQKVEVEQHDGFVSIPGTVGSGDERLEADAVILAVESGGLRFLADRIRQHAPRLAANAATLQEADPYSVVRFWLDRPVSPEHQPFYTVHGHTHTDGLAVYSSLQESAVDWARRTGGSVVETHAYAIGEGEGSTLESYRDGLLGELRQLMPELADASIVHEEAMTQHNFTGFRPGAHATRPTVETDVPNLFVAGDHVKLPFPAFLMEAAVSSGKLAANAILAADDVVEAPIATVPLRGPFA